MSGFGGEVLAAAALLTLLVGVPGWLFTRSLLFAPVAGACLFVPLSIVICSVAGLGTATVVLAWLAACGVAWLVRPREPERPAHAAIVALLVAAAAVLPASQAYPTVRAGGLYVAPPIYDHAKVAVVDSIAREGLPPVSPNFADGGAAVPLNYYWGLHFVMAQARVVLGVRGWAADVAGSWLAAAALIGAVAGIALRLGGRLRAGVVAVVLCVLGPPSPVLLDAFGGHGWFLDRLGAQRAMLNHMIWAPQHAIAAAALVYALFWATRPRRPRAMVVLFAGVFATTWACSSWMAIAFALLTPALLFVLRRERVVRDALLALPVAALFCIPLFLTQLAGARADIGAVPLRLHMLGGSPAVPADSALQIPLYWLHFLPLYVGIVYLIGLLVLAGYRREALLRRVSLVVIVGSFLISQFVRSAIFNNDLGWRCVLLGIAFLNAWCAVAAAQVFTTKPCLEDWRGTLVRRRYFWHPVWIGGVVLGVLGAAQYLRRPGSTPEPGVKALHARFFQQHAAWEKAREHAGPGELVQNNPKAFAEISGFAGNLSWSLFADRRTAVSDDHNAFAFAWKQPQARVQAALDAVRDVFETRAPSPAAVRRLRDELKIKVLVVERGDPVWPGDAIAASDAYRLVESLENAKIFVAKGN